MDRNIKVSVIIPVYGVEKFVGRCVESLMQQTLCGIEYIFIDDCTPDSSMEIVRSVIDAYPGRKKYVRYLSHPKNLGLPAARNTGLQAASGKYIFHCDSDDYLEPDMLECLYKEAETKSCDFVWSDWYLTFDTKSRIMRQPSADTPQKALTLLLSGAMRYNVWNKLVRRDLYTSTGITFPEGRSMGEDMTMIRLAAKAKKVSNVGKPLYHYVRTNAGAMTQIYSDRHLKELNANTDETCLFLISNLGNGIEQEINWFKLNVKLPFLFTGRRKDIEVWKRWYTESHCDIMTNSLQAPRTRLLQWCASHHMSAINLLYSSLIFNLFYSRFSK